MKGDSTLSIHEAEPVDKETGSLVTPIYQSATFGFAKAKDVVKAVRGETRDYAHSRWSNTTVERLESKLALLEGGEDCSFFSSGMAAISTAG